MRFEYEGKQYRMWFKHEHFGGNLPRASLLRPRMSTMPLPSAGEHPIRGRTTCEIAILVGEDKAENWKVVGRGVANCSVFDNYSKEDGRRVALKRAVETLGTPGKLWEIAHKAYANRKKAAAEQRQSGAA